MGSSRHFHSFNFQLRQSCFKAIWVRPSSGGWVWDWIYHQGRWDFSVCVSLSSLYSGLDLGFLFLHTSCASSKHLQTRRFLDTLQGYLLDIQRLLIQLHRSANERAAPFVDHLGILRDSKTGRAINGTDSDEEEEEVAMR